jgi:DNA polymerase-4
VVVGGKSDQRGVVATASYKARRFGLRSGMPLATAHRLCPEGVFLPGNFLEYRKASKEFTAILADFSPFLQPMGLDEAKQVVEGLPKAVSVVYLGEFESLRQQLVDWGFVFQISARG